MIVSGLLTNVEGDLVASGHKVLVRRLILRLHVLAVGQRQVLLGQLEGQLLVAMALAGGADFRHLVLGQRVKVALDLRSRTEQNNINYLFPTVVECDTHAPWTTS